MGNQIDLITKYATKAWDKVYKAEAISSLLDAPSGMVKFDDSFNGAKTVKIGKFMSGGLSDYHRANTPVEGNFGADSSWNGTKNVGFGYQTSDMALVWETFTMACDRAARFQIELYDNEETDGLAIGAATTEVSRTVMIPEVDAYCFAKIASYTSEGLGNLVKGTINADEALKVLNDALLYFDNHEVPAENQIIFVSPTYFNSLRSTKELVRYLSQMDYDKNVKFKLTEYEGRKFVMVPPQRFNTKVDLLSGGYRVSGDPIDFMIVAKDAVTHVVKYNKLKIISGDLNLAGNNFDGYTIYARIYHDVFVPDNKRIALYCHTGGFTYQGAAAGQATLDVTADSTGKITSITLLPGNIMAYFYENASAPSVGDDKSTNSDTQVIVGSTMTATGYVYAVDATKKVIAVSKQITKG